MEQDDRIFMINSSNQGDNRYFHLLQKHGYEVFATDNAYKLVKYALELHPRLYVVNRNTENVDAEQVIDYLSANHFLEKAPAVVVEAEEVSGAAKGASHYIRHKENATALVEIADAYCRGRKEYKVLLLEDYLPFSQQEFDGLDQLEVSYFKVYDVYGARLFLQKNVPQAVAIHCRKENYAQIKNEIGFQNTFYVENHDSMKKLISVLK